MAHFCHIATILVVRSDASYFTGNIGHTRKFGDAVAVSVAAAAAVDLATSLGFFVGDNWYGGGGGSSGG